MRKKILFIALLLSTITMQSILAQKLNISGTVSDDSGPLPGASVIVKGTITGASTDFDGNYTIQANSGDILVFSYVGMTPKEVSVGIETVINIVLESDNQLDEVVVVAYGTSSKEAITGSVAKISTADIQKRTVSSISSAIEGSTTGVLASAPSGQPGSGQNIRIRGFGSFGSSNSPLYVVDGIPINGSINAINPSDIESITILKDAGSTALYGNKAANGVILITTKKGKLGKGQLNVSYSTSVIQEELKSTID